jgi:ribosome-associated heat shock protein Hsp15
MHIYLHKMPEESQKRIDKFLWAIRVFKTRSLATEACKKGKILIDGIPVKASRLAKPGDRLEVKKLPVVYSYIVKDFPKSRISAKLVTEYVQDITSPEELHKLEIKESFFARRDRGTGRPTKKERRTIDKLREE